MKYRVGDKVKTIRNFGKGKHSVGTIVETFNSNTEYKVHFDNSGLYLWLSESEFETAEQLPFPIGTKVKCSYHGGNSFTGIFRGQSETFQDYWAIERDDAATGSGQNDWWNWDKSHGIEEVKLDNNVYIGYDLGISYDLASCITGNCAGGEVYMYDRDAFVRVEEPSFSREAFEPAEPLGECKPFNHLIDNKFMSIKNKIKMLMTGEPEKTLIKHGILTIDKELTTEGKQLFNEFIENKFKEEFLKGLYEVLKDEKLED